MTTPENPASSEPTDTTSENLASPSQSKGAKSKFLNRKMAIIVGSVLAVIAIILFVVSISGDKASDDDIQKAYGITIVDNDQAKENQFATVNKDFVTGEEAVLICERPKKDDVKETPELDCE